MYLHAYVRYLDYRHGTARAFAALGLDCTEADVAFALDTVLVDDDTTQVHDDDDIDTSLERERERGGGGVCIVSY